MLHEDVLGFMWVALCANWQGLTLKQTTKTLTGWLSMGQQCICWPSSPTTSSFQDLKVVGYKLDFSFTCMQRQQVERPSGFFTIINYSKDKASFRMLGVNYLCRWGMLGL